MAAGRWGGVTRQPGLMQPARLGEALGLGAFPPGDPCAAVAHELALSEMWSPDQWNAAVSLVMELRAAGMLPPLDAPATSAPLSPSTAGALALAGAPATTPSPSVQGA